MRKVFDLCKPYRIALCIYIGQLLHFTVDNENFNGVSTCISLCDDRIAKIIHSHDRVHKVVCNITDVNTYKTNNVNTITSRLKWTTLFLLFY